MNAAGMGTNGMPAKSLQPSAEELEMERLRSMYQAEADQAKQGQGGGGASAGAGMGQASPQDMSQYANIPSLMNMVNARNNHQLPFQNFM